MTHQTTPALSDPALLPVTSLAALRTRLALIPLVREMQVEVLGEAEGRLRLRAPLAPNVNDKGSAFGGSLASLMTLAGWALATRRLEVAGLEADVYVADSSLRYLAPLEDALLAEAWLEEGDWAGFTRTFRQRGRARCRIAACVRLPGGGEAATFSGRFAALAKA